MNDVGRINAMRGLSPKKLFSRIAFFGMLLTILIIGTICTVNAVRWVHKPFAGFLLNERMALATIGQYHWTGTQEGLKFPDKILKADGRTVSSMKELEEVISHRRIGDPVTYSVDRGGQILEVTVSTMRFTWVDLLMTFGLTFIAGITYMLIGLIVFVMKPNTKVSWVFLIACFFLSLYSITIFDMQSTHYGFLRLYLLAGAFAPAAFVHFSLYFPEPRRLILRYPRMQIVPYLISLMIITPLEILYPQEGFQIFYSLILVYMILAALAVLLPILAAYFKPISVLARQRAKVVFFGAALALPIPTVGYLSQHLFGSFLGVRVQTNFLTLFLLIFPASIAYAIARHNLFDVDVFIKRAVGYVAMTAIIVGSYLLVSVSLNVVVGRYQVAQSRAFPILFTLGVILIFNPLRNRIQTLVDRVFFRKEYDYGEIIDKISGAISSLLDLGQILNRLTKTFIEDMFINTSSVMLLNPARTEYQVYLADGERRRDVEGTVFRRDEPLMEIIEKEKKELTKYDVLEDPKYKAVSEGCAANFEALQASLMVPMVFQDQVIGFLNLGEKKSGKFYNREDIDLLHALANQGAVAVQNAQMVEEVIEKERMEEELSIARDLQTSMLPATCPEIEGFKLAALSTPAREVGGDFFDFIEMGEERVGLVVGDVTGKSV